MQRIVVLLLCLLALPVEAAPFFNRQRAQDDIQWRLNQDERRELARDAFDQMFKHAAMYLREENEGAAADRLLSEWNGHYRSVVMGITPEDVGDHTPFSEWMATWYQLLEDELGVQFMEMSHLRDIWVLNFTLKVVFEPKQGSAWCAEQLARHPSDTCEKEYARHFVGTKYGPSDPLNTAVLHHGFAGVVAYWVTMIACEVVTYGTGYFIICSPAATVIEIATEIFVAPDVSKNIWRRNNP